MTTNDQHTVAAVWQRLQSETHETWTQLFNMLTKDQQAVYSEIKTRNNFQAYPNTQELAAYLQRTPFTMQESLDDLTSLGLIRQLKTGRYEVMR